MILIILGTLAVVGATVAIGMLINRRIPLLPAPGDFEAAEQRERKKLASHGAGEAPATALRVREAQIVNLRSSQRCRGCRDRHPMRGDPDDTVRYDGTDLLVLHFTCRECGDTRTLYIERVS